MRVQKSVETAVLRRLGEMVVNYVWKHQEISRERMRFQVNGIRFNSNVPEKGRSVFRTKCDQWGGRNAKAARVLGGVSHSI